MSTVADSFDIILSLGANASSAVFTSSLSGFSVIGNATSSNLMIAGMGNIVGSSVQTLSIGQTKLGSVSFSIGSQTQFQIGIASGTNFNNSSTGQLVSVSPYAYVSGSVTTDANGAYLMNLVPGSYSVSANLNPNTIVNAVTAADALAALKIAVGMNPNSSLAISPYQILSADVNKDGKVTAADALSILKEAVKYPNAATPSWQFILENADLSQVSRTNASYTPTVSALAASFIQNMVGLIAGDVNGSWTSLSGANYLETVNPNYFTQLSQKISAPTSQWGI
jgi:hypothetical protein